MRHCLVGVAVSNFGAGVDSNYIKSNKQWDWLVSPVDVDSLECH